MELTYSLKEVDKVAQQILESSIHRNILFYGAMGSGKTTLIKALVKALGSRDNVSSPTFSLVNEYLDLDQKPIFHFDFYRIEHENEAAQLGLMDYYDAASWTFIEWPENINNFLPQHVHTAKLKSLKNNNRIIKFK